MSLRSFWLLEATQLILFAKIWKHLRKGQKLIPSKMQLNSPLLCTFYLHSCFPPPFSSLFFIHSFSMTLFFYFVFPLIYTYLLCSLPIIPGLTLGYYPIIQQRFRKVTILISQKKEEDEGIWKKCVIHKENKSKNK